MPRRAFSVLLLWLAVVGVGFAVPWAGVAGSGGGVAVAEGNPPPPETPPPSTFNIFYPEQRSLGECQNNSIPLPNCGSKARGGWRQYTVFGLIVGGIAFIVWRIVRASKRARQAMPLAPVGVSSGRPPDTPDRSRDDVGPPPPPTLTG